MTRRWRIALASAGLLYLVLLGLEGWMNAPAPKLIQEHAGALHELARSHCEVLREAARPRRGEPCELVAHMSEQTRALSYDDAHGEREQVTWRCEQGGALRVEHRAGLNVSGMCVGCRYAAVEIPCRIGVSRKAHPLP